MFSSTGAGIIMAFDLGVDYENFFRCSDVFNDTSSLGVGAACKWRTPKDLYIEIGKGENLIEIGKLSAMGRGRGRLGGRGALVKSGCPPTSHPTGS